MPLHTDKEFLVGVRKKVFVSAVIKTRVCVLEVVAVVFCVVDRDYSVIPAVVCKRVPVAKEVIVRFKLNNSADAVLNNVKVRVVITLDCYRAVQENYAVESFFYGY